MAEYILQGKKGSGKGIVAMGMIKDRLMSGRPVATNLNIFTEYLLPLNVKEECKIYRVPDQPTIHDLNVIGRVDTGGDESKNGLLVLDECANWLNSRDFRDTNRKELMDWFLHSRKFGWDVVYIIQDISMLDKQFREGFGEHVITAVRLDRLTVPVLGPLLKLFGLSGKLPYLHMGIVRYGQAFNSPVVDRLIYRGKPFWRAYDTLQRFTKNNEHAGVSSVLSPWHVKGRFLGFWGMHRAMLISGFLAGCLLASTIILFGGWFLGYERPKPPSLVVSQPIESDVRIVGYFFDSGRVVASLSDGRIVESYDVVQDKTGLSIKVGNVWYRETNK